MLIVKNGVALVISLEDFEATMDECSSDGRKLLAALAYQSNEKELRDYSGKYKDLVDLYTRVGKISPCVTYGVLFGSSCLWDSVYRYGYKKPKQSLLYHKQDGFLFIHCAAEFPGIKSSVIDPFKVKSVSEHTDQTLNNLTTLCNTAVNMKNTGSKLFISREANILMNELRRKLENPITEMVIGLFDVVERQTIADTLTKK